MEVRNPATVLLEVRVVKSIAEARNNTVVMANDDELVFPVLANEVWQFTFELRFVSVTVNPDLQFAFTIPALAALYKHIGINLAAGAPDELDGTVAITLAAGAAIRSHPLRYLYVGGANPGNVQMQWAQAAAVAEDTEVLAGSYILARRLPG